MNYTALGNTVNLAARLEGLNKQFGTTIPCERRRLFAGSALLPVQSLRVGHCQGHDEGNPHLRAGRGRDMKSTCDARCHAKVVRLVADARCLSGSRRRGHHQNRNSPFFVRHHGNQRVGAQGHRSHADSGPKQEGGVCSDGNWSRSLLIPRPIRTPLRSSSGGYLSSDGVAVVFGCWASASRRVRAADFRGTERPALLPCAVRG